MKKLLIVDDDAAVLWQLAAQLKGHYDLRLVKSGAQALQASHQERPDLVLMDVMMPDMDGFQTLARFKQNPWLEHIPVIFLTGDPDAEAEGLQAGARDFLTKPVEKNLLLHRIELHLRFGDYQLQLENRIRETADSIAASFTELIECRDENTGGHVARTGRYVRTLARALLERGLFPEELTEGVAEMYARAAPLHDIGKIAISDRILLKPGPLTDEEFAVMQRHTTIGAEILGRMYARTPAQRYLRYAQTIAASHHERYDGKGYPSGLSGDGIPLCGRIMIVADVYDALVSDRVYRRGMSAAQARSIILDGKGTLFDPRIVEVFESSFDAAFKAGDAL